VGDPPAHRENGNPKALPLIPSVLVMLSARRGAPGALVFPAARDANKPYRFESRRSRRR
jgi:hypothetical protein